MPSTLNQTIQSTNEGRGKPSKLTPKYFVSHEGGNNTHQLILQLHLPGVKLTVSQYQKLVFKGSIQNDNYQNGGWGLPLLSFTDSGLTMAQGFFPNKHIAYSDKVDKKKRWGLPFVQWMCLFSEGTIFTFGSNGNPALRHTQMALVSS